MYRDYLIFPLVEERTEASILAIGRGSRTFASRSPIKYRDSAVIHYILSGSGLFDGVKVTAGQGFFFYPGEMHDYYGLDEDNWEYVFIEIAAPLADRIVVPVIHADERGIFSFSFRDWLQKWSEKYIGTETLTFVTETEAVYLASSIFRRHTLESPSYDSRQQLYVKKAQIFIGANLDLPLQVSDVAKAMNLNPRYLCKLFVQYTGTGIKEYITDLKVQLAQELLTETELPIKEIASEVGIGDPNSFSKLFHLRTGTSPSNYRANFQK